MAVFITDALPKYDSADLKTTVKRLHDYATALSEQLRFLLANLDEDNIPALSVLNEQVSDAMGNLAALTLSAEGLTSRVESAEGGLSTLQQTASGLTTRVEDAEGNITALAQNAAGLTTRVANAEGAISTVQQTANGLESTVSDLDGKYTSIKQTVDSIDIEGELNSVMQDGVARIAFVRSNGTSVGAINAVASDLHIGAENDLYLSSGDMVYIQNDTEIQGGLRIYLSSTKYWEFDTDGIHYHSSGGESVTVMGPV